MGGLVDEIFRIAIDGAVSALFGFPLFSKERFNSKCSNAINSSWQSIFWFCAGQELHFCNSINWRDVFGSVAFFGVLCSV